MLELGGGGGFAGGSGKASLKRGESNWTMKDVQKHGKEREGHSRCGKRLGKGFGYRNEPGLFRDSEGTDMY